jgi:hypothetical protein
MFSDAGTSRGRSKAKNVISRRTALFKAAIEPLEKRTLLSGSWTAITNAPIGIKAMLLLSNGDVIAQDGEGTDWAILTPSNTGSYLNGTWARISNAHDTRVFYSSQILTNGNLFVAGGEDGSGAYKSEVYNPLTNTWTETPQANAGGFEDSNSEILANGDVMIPPVYTTTYGGTVLYNPNTNSWSTGPTLYRGDDADEQTWIKLADGSILTVDGFSSTSNATSERYIPSTNTWVNDGTLPVPMSDNEGEMGPAALLPNGKVFFTGANGNTAIYIPSGFNSSDGIYTPNGSTPGSWTAGPAIPGGLGEDDAPCSILPDGNVLIASSPYDDDYSGPSSFFIYNAGANTISALSATNTPTQSGGADGLRFLDLPDGTVLMSSGSSTVYDFNPGDAPLTVPDPTISGISHNSDGSYTLTGTRLNGPSEGAIYGDDAQMNTNYPIVRLNNSSGTYYARTYNWSSTGVDTGATPETTNFTLPQGLPAGTYNVNVMVNGYISAAATLTTPYTSDTAPTITSAASASSSPVTGVSTTLSVGATGSNPLTFTWVNTSAPSGDSTASFSVNANSSASTTTATFQQAGTYTFKVTVTDADGLSATSSVTVTVNQKATSIAITPGPVDLTAGQTQQLSAEEYDQFGIAMSSQPGSFTWAETSGAGSINSSGLYTSPSTGTQAVVTATAGTVVGTTTMDVVDSPWAQVDINSPPVTGTGFDTGGTFNISGSGDRSYTTEQGHFVYRSLGGNGTIVANVSSQSMSTSSDAEAGLMISQSTAAGAQEVLIALSPGSGVFMQERTSLDADYGDSAADAGFYAPYFLKLVRNGNTFTGYYSTNGTTWTEQGSETVVMSGAVDIGMFVFGGTNNSNGTSVPGTATFTDLGVIAAAGYTVSVLPGASASLNLLSGDVGPTGSTLSITGITQGSKGSVTLNASGGATYTASTTAVGTDSFTYTMSDGLGDTATGTVTVDILGIVAYYKMNEGSGTTTADATCDGYTGAITGATWGAGVAGDGLAFDGNGEFVTLPAMNLSTNTVTFSGWVDSAGTQADAAGIIFNREGSDGNGLDMYDGNDLGYTWGTDSATYNFDSHLALPVGTWTFVALVITPNSATIYMEPLGGSLSSATQDISLPTEPFDQSILIGEDTNSDSRCFNGSMDEVRIYNTNLSSAAINALAQKSSFLTAVPQTITAHYGAPGTVNVLANDSGPDGSTLSVVNFNQPAYGIVSYNASAGFTYSPTTLNSGTDSFTYTLSDGLGDTTTGVMNVTILGNIAYYKFDEGTGSISTDATGDGYNAVLNNTTWTTGLTSLSVDHALSFNGTSSNVTFASSPSLSGTTDFSVGAWIKTSSTTGGVIIQQRDANGFNGEYGLSVNANGTVAFYIYYNNYQFQLTSTTTVNNNKWTQLTAERSGLNGYIYINGTLAANGSGTSVASLSSSITVDIGADNREASNYFAGSIDDVFISDTALTSSAISLVSRLGPVVNTAATATPSLVAGTSSALAVVASDYYDSAESSTPLSYHWVVTSLPTGASTPSFAANSNSSASSTVANFYMAGNYVLGVTITDAGGLTTTSSVAITVSQTLTSVTLSSGTIAAGKTTQATALDQFGNAFATQPTWTATGGTINSTGLFTAGSSGGTFTITATNGTSLQASLTVVPTAYTGIAGSDSYAIRLSPGNSSIEQIFVNTPLTGSPTYSIGLNQLSSLLFTTAGDGTVTVSFANGNPLPSGGVGFSGGRTLYVAGNVAGGMGFTITGSEVIDSATPSSPIIYSSLQNIEFDLAGGANTLTQLSQPTAAVTYNAGPLSNTLNISGGTFTISSDPQVSSGSLTVNDNANLTFSAPAGGSGFNPRNLYALNLGTDAIATLLAAPTASSDRTVLETSNLSVAAGATLNLTDNAMIIHGGSLSTLTALIAKGLNAGNGYWNGTGITSSSAAGDSSYLTALGIISNNGISGAILSSFDHQPVTNADVLIKYTYYGDTNLDGKVDGTDYSRIDSAYLTPATGWFNGDFNYDNHIDGSDYTLMDNAFNSQSAPLAVAIATPNAATATSTSATKRTASTAAKQLVGTATRIPTAAMFPDQLTPVATSLFSDVPISSHPEDVLARCLGHKPSPFKRGFEPAL